MRGAARPGALPAAILGALVAAGLALAPSDLAAGLVVVVVLSLPVVLGLGARSSDPEARHLLLVFAVAVAVRVGVAIAVAYGTSSGFFALDDDWYAQAGWELARYWAGQGPAPSEIYGEIGYYRWNAVLFTLLGRVPVAPALGNAAIGGFTVLLAHGLAREVAGVRAARTAAWLAALWPSLVLWSSLNLKDGFAILAILLILRGAQRLSLRLSLAGSIPLAAGFAILSQLRGYLVLLAVVAVALAWLLARLRAAPLAGGALLLAAALVLPAVGPVGDLALETQLESLDRAREQMAQGASAYHGDADVSTTGAAVRFLPVGLAYFLLAPAPWQVLNTRQLLTLPEMLVWYALLPMVGLGALAALRQRFAAALPVFTFAVLTTLSYALVEGNLGTAYRHRAQVLVLLLVFAAVGLEHRRAAARARAARPAPSLFGPAEQRA